MPYPYRSFRDWLVDEEEAGNVLRIKTPIKCGDYNHIVDIGNGIPGKQPETEMRAFARYLHSLPGKPIGFIENPVNNRPDIPVIVNPWPNRERVLSGMGMKTKDEFCSKIEDIRSKRVKPAIIPRNRAPCKEVIIPEAKVDLRTDISRCWVEFNQCLFTGCNGTIATYDPETKTHDLCKTRFGPFDALEYREGKPNEPWPEDRVKREAHATLAIAPASPVWGQGSSVGRYYSKNFRSKNKPMPCAYAFGVPTDVHMAAAFRGFLDWPRTGDEYEIVGAWRGEPIELTESETVPGLMVPADAEWIIEGEFLPEEITTPPFAEDIYHGHIVGRFVQPVFRVKCITHRKDPWWTDATFSSSGLNGHQGMHGGLLIMSVEGDLITYLRNDGFQVKDVVGTAYDMRMLVVQLAIDGIEKPVPYYGKLAGMAVETRFINNNPPKYIIVVGPDINPYDLTDVMWAVYCRALPAADTLLISGTYVRPELGDYSTAVTKLAGQVAIIDATIKVPERYASFPPRSEPVEWETAAIERMKRKLANERPT